MSGRSAVLVLAAVAIVAAACGQPVSSPSPSTSQAVDPTPSASVASTATPSVGPTPTPAPTSLSVMDFNIEYGGQQVDFAKIAEALRLADPDIAAIEEAEGHTEELAKAAGYPYANVRNQVISRYPIIDPPGANGRYVFVEVAPGEVVAISNVHLPSDPYGPYLVRDGGTVEEVIKLENDTRMPAIQARLDVLPVLVAAGIPTFLTGDFNAPSHLDWTEAAVGTRPQVKYPVPWPVSTAIEAAGFTDAYRALHPDPVADPGLTWWAGRPIVDDYPDHKDPQDRIDIIYASGTATPTDIRIVGEVGGPQVDLSVDPWGTDHRGVLGTFDVQPGVAAPYVSVDQRLVETGGTVTVRYHGADPAGSTLRFVPVGSTDPGALPPPPSNLSAVDGVVEARTTSLGDFEARLMVGADVVAATPFTVSKVDARPTLTVESTTVRRGEPIEVSWRDVPGSRWDWLGIYKRGGDPLDDDYLYYQYTDQSVAGSGVIDAKGEPGELDWPLPPGRYDVHYLLDDGYTSLAHASFRVTE